ncbi:MAG: hypothetical protein R3228_07930 [Halioglobus sp.]|nr:hypothetical protein [Halioglobus sp.]
MLTLNKLEKVIELEEQLRAEYQGQLDEKAAQIKVLQEEQAQLQATVDKQQGTIDTQLQTITELSGQSSDAQRTEQLNRELSNRAEKLQDEVTELKKRVKTLQKERVEERTELKALKQFDPARMKKNLDATKKKLAEKNKANDALQKSLGKARSEGAEQQRKVKELEAKLEELQALLNTEEAAA